ncbi:uncharacterized protein LOC109793694 [Cajanus cajan]|uniref:uncharacterized protein LOC109793695 n=1 Tax=Cajanus cajan TaxID=3821 RepID=UPI00098DC19F|nr:uncharacterized protein LOC109793695 [Cajanus cajan]XP_029126235.1 uncharacterized protein LOC109793694 [Cajanus cajan]
MLVGHLGNFRLLNTKYGYLKQAMQSYNGSLKKVELLVRVYDNVVVMLRTTTFECISDGRAWTKGPTTRAMSRRLLENLTASKLSGLNGLGGPSVTPLLPQYIL